MKMVFGKRAYDQLDEHGRSTLKPIACHCTEAGPADDNCEICDGGGTVYEWALSVEDASAIEENFRRQGVPLGKADSN
jgi:hypothetical protein